MPNANFNLAAELAHQDKTPESKQNLQALWNLTKILLYTLDFDKLVYSVVNSLLTELGYLNLGYRIVVLSLIDKNTQTLHRIALSSTEEATKATSVSAIPFEKIAIPLTARDNYCVKVMFDNKPLVTTDWANLLCPPLTPDQARTNQHSAGIKTSMVYPVYAHGEAIGSLIFSMIKDYNKVTEDEKDLLLGFSDIVGLAVQNSILYTSLKSTKDSLTLANKEIYQKNIQLRELDKLKDDFVSVASHELRTPMTAIRSYTWMALYKSDQTLSPKMQRNLSRILISTERLINLVNDMLNVSRIESGRIEIDPKSFNLFSLISDVLSEVSAKAAEKKLKFQTQIDQNIFAFADVDKVHQVLLNLIGNAMKFTPPEGSITIKVISDGKIIETSIHDSGVGINHEDLGRLFQKFGRLDNSYVASASSGGTGLGLYICKNLIQLMKGSIWATSEGSNKGSTFTFTLPLATSSNVSNSQNIHPIDAKPLEPVAI